MKLDSIRRALGRPALHGLLTVLFGGAFMWPMFALTSARQTWWFLHVAWGLSMVGLLLVSRGRESSEEEEEESTANDRSE